MACAWTKVHAQAAGDSVRTAPPRSAPGAIDRGLATRTRQTLTVSGTERRYRIGAVDVQERAAPMTWRLVSPRVAARVSGIPVSLDAADAQVQGVTPIRARLDFILRAGDTLSVYGRRGSTPRTLNSVEASALGAAGTSVLDLSSLSMGLASQVGVRGKWSLPVGSVVLGVSAAAERDLPPPATGVVFWQGTTVRGGASVTGLVGEQTLTVSADISSSQADSLGGRNQFPGGGAFTLGASSSGAVNEAGTVWFSGDVFYVRPFGNDRNDQPTRLIPQGSFGGVSGLLLLESGTLTWTPTVSLLRESSAASVTTVQQGTLPSRTSLRGSAWSVAAGLSVDLPLGASVTVSPEVGAVSGTVSSSLAQTNGRIVGRRGRVVNVTNTSAFNDAVRGWWGGLSLSVRY
ncbi:hypothetical protein GEMMAAP_14780 [Gemmatimonas phototrophica]|uniref:Uncharacterized protein n=1 Tax=Gemmatimonas phototrophica TaxID=1379270 RepID=A0A143BL40_9BACT|nr:hypothetical protein GEMMAAP_14780 [Gemmatimonas phototrophica]